MDLGEKDEKVRVEKKAESGEEVKDGAADKIKEENKGETDVKVEDKDRKKHEEIGDKIKAQLQETEGKDILELQKNVNKEGENLEDKYQPSLKKGINLDVKTESADKAKKDGDVDVRVEIKPNDYIVDFGIKNDNKEINLVDFRRFIYRALEKTAETHYKGGESIEFDESKPTYSEQDLKDDNLKLTKEQEEKQKDKIDKEADKILKDEGKSIHLRISAAQEKYRRASKALSYPNNTFIVGSGEFFVETSANFYIVPDKVAKNKFEYGVDGSPIRMYLKRLNKDKSKLRQEKLNDSKADDINKDEKDTLLQQVENLKIEINEINSLKRVEGGEGQNKLIETIKSRDFFSTALNEIKKKKVGIALDQNIITKYSYHKAKIEPKDAKEKYLGFPTSITDEPKETVFLAALLAEPSRWSVSHITNLLFLNKDSDLDNKSETVRRDGPKDGDDTASKKQREGNYESTGLYEHTSMTQAGSDKRNYRNTKYEKDTKLGFNNETDINKNVTERDLAAVQRNSNLVDSLKSKYKENITAQKSDDEIIDDFVAIISNYLKF